jgi:chromosome segregation ATPase
MSGIQRFWCHEASNIFCVRASDFDRVAAERDGLQLSLTTADQTIDDLQAAIARRNVRIDELLAEIETVRQGPCKMIVGDELP